MTLTSCCLVSKKKCILNIFSLSINDVSKEYVSDIALPTMKPFSFINIRGNEFMHFGGSYANEEECMAVLNLVQKIEKRKVPGWDSCDKLRIITF